MDVQTKATELVDYTIDNALKEKIIPKRDRWALGNRLIDAALEIATRIDMANSLNLDDAEEVRQRRLEQRMALAATFSLNTLIHTARSQTHFEEDIHKYWTQLVSEEQKLLKGWMDSDRKRKATG